MYSPFLLHEIVQVPPSHVFGGPLGFSRCWRGRMSCQRLPGIGTLARWGQEGGNERGRASFGQLCLHPIKKVSDSITQVWGPWTPNIWISGQAPKTPGCCTSHLESCRHPSNAVLERASTCSGCLLTSSQGLRPAPRVRMDRWAPGTPGWGGGRGGTVQLCLGLPLGSGL